MTHADAKNFQPANITFDLLPPLEHKIRDRQERHRQQCELALQEFDAGWKNVGRAPSPAAFDLDFRQFSNQASNLRTTQLAKAAGEGARPTQTHSF